MYIYNTDRIPHIPYRDLMVKSLSWRLYHHNTNLEYDYAMKKAINQCGEANP